MQEKGEESHPKLEERRCGKVVGVFLVAGVNEEEENEGFVRGSPSHTKHTCTCMRGEGGEKGTERKREERVEKLTRGGRESDAGGGGRRG